MQGEHDMVRRIDDRPRTDGRGASESKLEQFKNEVARKMRSAASSIRNSSQRGNADSTVSPYAERASSWLETSSDYLSRNDIDQIKGDVRNQIRRNPGRSLLVAGAAGLILGAMLRNRR